MVRLAVVGAIVASALGCVERHPAPKVAPAWTPFVEMARQSACADARNRLFVVDHVLVFWDRAGNCPDSSYSLVLYKQTVNDLLCDFHDSIAGPRKNCPVPGYRDMFETMIGHLDEPDLGLGADHTVQQLPLLDATRRAAP